MNRNVVSLQVARKLAEAGWTDSDQVWRVPMAFGDDMAFVESRNFKREPSEGLATYPAPGPQELADELPPRIFIDQVSGGRWRARREWGELDEQGELRGAFHAQGVKIKPKRLLATADTIANSLGLLFIQLQEQK